MLQCKASMLLWWASPLEIKDLLDNSQCFAVAHCFLLFKASGIMTSSITADVHLTSCSDECDLWAQKQVPFICHALRYSFCPWRYLKKNFWWSYLSIHEMQLVASGETPSGLSSLHITYTRTHICSDSCHTLRGVCQCTDEQVHKQVSVVEKLFI